MVKKSDRPPIRYTYARRTQERKYLAANYLNLRAVLGTLFGYGYGNQYLP